MLILTPFHLDYRVHRSRHSFSLTVVIPPLHFFYRIWSSYFLLLLLIVAEKNENRSSNIEILKRSRRDRCQLAHFISFTRTMCSARVLKTFKESFLN